MAEKFGGGTQGREIGNDIEEIGRGENTGQSVSDIRKKYEKKLAVHQGSGPEVCILKISSLDDAFVQSNNLIVCYQVTCCSF